MQIRRALCLCMVLFMVLGVVDSAWAYDQAQNTVNNIRQADPPRVPTTTKESPVGQPVSDYKPSGGSLTVTEPPSPRSSYNPNNDPDVQAGYDAHQSQYNN